MIFIFTFTILKDDIRQMCFKGIKYILVVLITSIVNLFYHLMLFSLILLFL